MNDCCRSIVFNREEYGIHIFKCVNCGREYTVYETGDD